MAGEAMEQLILGKNDFMIGREIKKGDNQATRLVFLSMEFFTISAQYKNANMLAMPLKVN